jgi:tetratricopeptide (TPR) repeat protein
VEKMTSAQELKQEGLRLFQEGLYEEAITRFGQAQERFAAEGNEIEMAEMMNNLGEIYRRQGEGDEAKAALDEARATFVRLGDRSREAQTLANLSRLYAGRGERDKAEECLRQAADIFAGLGDAQRQGETLLELGKQMWKAGDRSRGLAAYEAGLRTLQKPTVGQKALRGLSNLRTRLLSGRKG